MHTHQTSPVDTAPLHLPHAAETCDKCFAEQHSDRLNWFARPAGSRLVGLVIAREGMPPVRQQREDLTRFGVQIADFRHPAPEVMESWPNRLERFLQTLHTGDVLVVANEQALGRTVEESVRIVDALRARGVMVKVLSHAARHLRDANR